MKNTTTRVYVPILCCLHFLLGAALIPLAGIQNDEALFANPIYQNSYEFSIRLFRHNIPLMVISYIGTLKTSIYWLIFHLAAPSAWSVRLPVLLLGTITIFIFYRLADMSVGRVAAVAAAVLLATDPTFLLTNTFDWGPVAFEHFLLVTACLLFVRFAKTGGFLELSCGSILLGLALWNKAIFVWALTGLLVATATIFWTELRARLRWENVRIIIAGFLVGASPFVIYNIKKQNATVRENVHLELPDWNAKFLQVRGALEGRSLLGYLVNEDSAEKPKQPGSGLGRMAFWIRSSFGEHRGGLMTWAAGLSLLLVPLWWRYRAARFSVVFCAVTWLMMAITKDAGGSAHHAVLLWPFPHLLVAITLAAIPWRPATAALVIVLASANLLVWNQHLYQFERDGAAPVFTDALNPLSDRVGAYPGSSIYITDWGMWNTLALLHQGRLPISGIDDLFPAGPQSPEINRERQEMVARVFANRDAIFVSHVAEQEIFKGVSDRLDKEAEMAGLSKRLIETISDSNGRPMFEIFRLAPR